MSPRTLDLFQAVYDSDIPSIQEFLHSEGNVNAFDENGNNALILAVRAGDLDVIEILCKNGADVNLTSPSHNAPLMEAVSSGRMCVVEFLCDNGADVNAVNDEGLSPLMWISEDEDEPIARLLIEKHKADVNHKNKRGVSVLIHAADKGFTRIVQVLIDSGASLSYATVSGWSALLKATRNKDFETVQLLLQNGVDVNQVTRDGWNALMLACYRPCHLIAQLLVDAGAELNLINAKGFSPLMYACYNGAMETVKLLLERGADLVKIANDGMTALQLARLTGNSELIDHILTYGDAHKRLLIEAAKNKDHVGVVRMLLECGIDVNTTDGRQKSVLMMASELGNLEAVRSILERPDVNVNAANKRGWNSLMLAAFGGHCEVVGELLQKGAEVDAVNSKGNNSLLMATHQLHLEMVQLLLGFGSDVNHSNQDGWTAVMLAAQNEALGILQVLLQHQASVNMSNHQGQTALMLASEYGHIDIIQQLLCSNENAMDTTASHLDSSEIRAQAMTPVVDVHKMNKKGETALVLACKGGHEKIVEILIEKGSNVNHRSEDGTSPLKAAVSCGHSPIVECLLKNKAGVDVADEFGDTALMTAAKLKNKTTAEILMRYNANLDHKNSTNLTAWDIAENNGSKDILDLMQTMRKNRMIDSYRSITLDENRTTGSDFDNRRGEPVIHVERQYCVTCSSTTDTRSNSSKQSLPSSLPRVNSNPATDVKPNYRTPSTESLISHEMSCMKNLHSNPSSIPCINSREEEPNENLHRNSNEYTIKLSENHVEKHLPEKTLNLCSHGPNEAPANSEGTQANSGHDQANSERESGHNGQESPHAHELCERVLKVDDVIRDFLRRDSQPLKVERNLEMKRTNDQNKTDEVKQGNPDHNNEKQTWSLKNKAPLGPGLVSNTAVPLTQARQCEVKKGGDQYYNSSELFKAKSQEELKEFLAQGESPAYANMKASRDIDSGSQAREGNRGASTRPYTPESCLHPDSVLPASRSDELLKPCFSEFTDSIEVYEDVCYIPCNFPSSVYSERSPTTYQEALAMQSTETYIKQFTRADSPSEISYILNRSTSPIETDCETRDYVTSTNGCLEYNETQVGPVTFLQSDQTSFFGPSRTFHLDDNRPRKGHQAKNNIIIGTADVVAFEQSHLKCATRRGILRPRVVPLDIDAEITQPLLCSRGSAMATDSSDAEETLYETVGQYATVGDPIDSSPLGVDSNLNVGSSINRHPKVEQYPQWINDIIQAVNTAPKNGSQTDQPMQLNIHYDATVHNVTIPSTQFCAINNSSITTTNEVDSGNTKDITMVRGKKEPLSPEEDLTIRKNFSYLKRNLNPILIADLMCREGIFDSSDMEDVMRPRFMKRKSHVLLQKMLNAGSGDAFDVFMDALENVHPRVADKLKSSSLESLPARGDKRRCCKCCVQ
ncbi:unnamed protein product [Lymnaea stagnalis]|uniref:CARD domain-containing protein n=1 Tax=Lymnaea stagnalis TaxID=6523 RepID=A0AAV2IJB5_LYMST